MRVKTLKWVKKVINILDLGQKSYKHFDLCQKGYKPFDLGQNRYKLFRIWSNSVSQFKGKCINLTQIVKIYNFFDQFKNLGTRIPRDLKVVYLFGPLAI